MLNNTVPHRALAAALRERLAIIADRGAAASAPAAHLERLKAVSERINALAKELPQPVDPHLAHYLQRSSFDKALALLEANGGNTPEG